MKILLIDDNPHVLEVLSLMLAADGHAVVTAGDGRQGLAQLENGGAVDLVLTDAAMPDMPGRDIVRRVRRDWPGVRVGIISASPDYLTDDHDSVDLVIAKPVSFESLSQAIRSLK